MLFVCYFGMEDAFEANGKVKWNDTILIQERVWRAVLPRGRM